MNKKELLKGIKSPAKVKTFVTKLNQLLKKANLNATAMVGGSLAKGTYLKNPDIDIFVQFDKKYIKEDISELLKKAIKTLKSKVIHGSRDYFQVKSFELVPVIKIKDPK